MLCGEPQQVHQRTLALCDCSQVDEIYIEFIRERGLYDKIWQAFAVFLDVRSVGVQVNGNSMINQ